MGMKTPNGHTAEYDNLTPAERREVAVVENMGSDEGDAIKAVKGAEEAGLINPDGTGGLADQLTGNFDFQI
jgi:hypothetical protein